MTTPRPPSDNTTLQEVLAGYEGAGFTAQFTSAPEGLLRCSACTSVVEAKRVKMHSMRRLEGASDPGDMMAVVALTCPVCGASGTSVLGFGPMASAEDSDVLVALRDLRSDDELPPSSSPSDSSPSGT
jgi:hypothetical protein